MRLPDFVVLGQGKAGTSLIYRVLSAHPDIGLSTPKELHYFSVNHDKGVGWYQKHFAKIDPNVARIGEVSPSYLRASTIERVAETLGRKTKVVFVLRKPIEQNYARYIQNICARQEAPGFHIRIRPLPHRLTRIEEALTRAYALFGPDNVLPLVFEQDIATVEPKFESKILSFLGLSAPRHPTLPDRVNRSVMPRYLYGGDAGFRMIAGDGASYWIPARRLIFCAQERNSQVWHDAPVDEVSAALARQSEWSAEVSEAQYAELQARFVVPAAERLMEIFGLDLSHWTTDPARRLSYQPAPPPPQFRSKDRDVT